MIKYLIKKRSLKNQNIFDIINWLLNQKLKSKLLLKLVNDRVNQI